MRVIFKHKNKEIIKDNIKTVTCESFMGDGHILMETNSGIISVYVPLEELEGIKVCFLRDGYYDFRAYRTYV